MRWWVRSSSAARTSRSPILRLASHMIGGFMPLATAPEPYVLKTHFERYCQPVALIKFRPLRRPRRRLPPRRQRMSDGNRTELENPCLAVRTPARRRTLPPAHGVAGTQARQP